MCQHLASEGGSALIGTAADVRDRMGAWMAAECCDGFNVTPDQLPGGCEDLIRFIAPALQGRGRIHTTYEGETLRETLGLKPHVSRYVTSCERTRMTAS